MSAALVDCPRCGNLLALTDARRRVGTAYLLNALPGLVASGVIDEATAARIASAVGARAAGTVASQAADVAPQAPVAPAGAHRVAARSPTAARADDALAGDRTPTLLLYVGAFLLVVSALIFVGVSGSQISDALKLGLVVVGTLGFLAAGVICYARPIVRPAGRTFLAVGALLVPIDVAAIYALFLRTTPLSSPLLWLWASLLAAALYATLALQRYGSWYARAFFVATASALAAALRLADVDGSWWPPAFAALTLPHLVAWRRAGGDARRLTSALLIPAHATLAVVLVLTAFAALVSLVLDDRSTRIPTALTVALAAAAYAVRFDLAASRRAALALVGLLPVALVYAAREPGWAYGLAFLAVAVVYAAAPRIASGSGLARRVPAGTLDDVAWLAYAWAALALVPVTSYERVPAVGALVYLGVAALVAIRLSEPAVYVSAALLHVGLRYALLGAGLMPAAHASPREVAALWSTAVFLGSLVLVAATVAAARRRTALRDAAAISAAASSVIVVALGTWDPARLAAFAAAYAVVALVATVRLRREEGLWAAGAFAATALLAAWQARAFSGEDRILGLALLGLLLYVLGLALRRPAARYRRALREVAVGYAALAAVTGAWVLVARDPFHPSATVLWQMTTWCVLVVGALLAAEARVRRLYALLVAGSAVALLATLMEVAHFEVADVQWYATPVGLYLIALALVTLRYGPRSWDEAVPTIEAIGAVVLLAPTYRASWDADGLLQGIRLVAESVVLLLLGATLRRRLLAAAAVTFLVLAGLRAVVDLLDRLPTWVVFSTSGAVLLVVGFVLLLRRDAWTRAQERAVRWWRSGEGARQP